MRLIPNAPPAPLPAPHPRRGFTLVELLVVMGIIAILVSIVLPVVGRARRQSKTVACLANLKALQEAFIGYVNTNHHAFVYQNTISLPGQTLPAQLFTWEGALQPLFSNDNVKLCAEATEASNSTIGKATQSYGITKNASNPASVIAVAVPFTPGGPTSTFASNGSYGFNGFLYYPDPNQLDSGGKVMQPNPPLGGMANTTAGVTTYTKYWFSDPTTLDGGAIPPAVTSAAGYTPPPNFGSAGSVPVFGDCNSLDAWPDQTDPTSNGGKSFRGTGDTNAAAKNHSLGRFCMDRHPTGVNIVFLDGSARSVSLPELWLLRWNKSFVPTTVSVP